MLLPSIIILLGFLFFISDACTRLKEFHTLRDNTEKIQNISSLINTLQKERGLSSGFLATQGKSFQHKLTRQYNIVNSALLHLIKSSPKKHQLYENLQKKLKKKRESIKRLTLSPQEALRFYTDTIKILQIDYLKLLKDVKERKLKNRLLSYAELSFAKEALGEIRGSVNALIPQEKKDEHLIALVILAQGKYQLSQERLYAIISRKYAKKLEKISQSSQYNSIQNTLLHILNNNTKSLHITSKEWFQKSSFVIEQFFILELDYLNTIDKYIEKKSHNLLLTMFGDALLFFLVTFITIFLALRLKRDIIQNISLLEQYKLVVDRSSIVSKTDKSGRITYTNEQFCNISGYSQEELLGKNHNLVRHPDMPKEAFQEMWRTIREKKPWFGIVKNRKKDGREYIVEVTISPILNHKGEIEEFIAIRNDITELMALQKELEKTQEDIIFRIGEIGEKRSKETGFHVRRVANYSGILAKYYGLDEEEITRLVQASPMHDIGKVGIPDSILNKEERLNEKELTIMKTHAQIGYDLFKNSDKKLLKTAAIIAHEHHEKYDGTGYPQGLKGEQIHIYGRITSVADVFDALGTKRVYKDAWSAEKIYKFFQEQRGIYFDPKLVDILLEHFEEFVAIRNKYNDDID